MSDTLLSGLPQFLAAARDGGLDSRPILLRVQTDMFVAAQSHTAASRAAFESLALAMIPTVDDDTVALVAEKLAHCPDLPLRVRTALLERGGGAARAVVAGLQHLDQADIEAIALSDDTALIEGLAARADLAPELVSQLIGRALPPVDLAIAGNLAVTIERDDLDRLLARAADRPDLARALLKRDDIDVAAQAMLYLHAAPGMRQRIRRDLARLGITETDRAPISLLDDETVRLLIEMARRRDELSLRDTLSAATGLPAKAIEAVLQDSGAEMLALVLLVLGFEPEEAAAIFLSRPPAVSHSVLAVFGLVELMRQTPRSVAERIVILALGSRLAGQTGRYVPAMDASKGVRHAEPAPRPARAFGPGQAHQVLDQAKAGKTGLGA